MYVFGSGVMDKRIGFGLYQSYGNRGCSICVFVEVV